ncbi:DUF5995 family protein [Kitasatospora sp. NPDC001660]
MYLRVTELVGAKLTDGFFQDAAFIERMDVIFAGLFFRNVDAARAGGPVNPAWRPLVDARRRGEAIWPIPPPSEPSAVRSALTTARSGRHQAGTPTPRRSKSAVLRRHHNPSVPATPTDTVLERVPTVEERKISGFCKVALWQRTRPPERPAEPPRRGSRSSKRRRRSSSRAGPRR